MRDSYLELAQRIYSQLTDYARELIDKTNISNKQLNGDISNYHRVEGKLLKQNPGNILNVLPYVLKGHACLVSFKHDGCSYDEVNAKIKMQSGDNYIIITDSGTEYVVKGEDILGCSVIEYK